MAKHKKKNIQQLVQKRQQLQNVIAGNQEFTAVISDRIVGAVEITSPKQQPEENTVTHHAVEIRHTLISLAVIIILLAVSVYLDHKTTYFNTFGTWLYTVLRLKS